ncbi:MAG: radical SAM protein [Actinomycetota bacterium]|nr:radical SAM protein [Actinomycetota bacterium]
MKLSRLSELLEKNLQSCTICPHRCGVNRIGGEKGFCLAGYRPTISAALPHHGEEPPISGSRGSGTIFFSYCNIRCVYCQNFQISQEFEGTEYSIAKLTKTMLGLESSGCHNINLVSPTIWIPRIIKALYDAREKGLLIPTVYNTGGYDSPEIIKMLEGKIDIYMPDMRYSDDEKAKKYSHIKEYTRYNRQSVKEMYRQVGGLKLDKNGVAVRGLLIRLLVIPENIGGIKSTLDFIKNELSTDVYLSIMAQYHPAYKASRYPELNRTITAKEYLDVVKYAEKKGFNYGWTQDYLSLNDNEDLFMPDFKDKKVFKYYNNKNKNTNNKTRQDE